MTTNRYRTTFAALAAAALLGVLTSCVSANLPRGVLNVPGTYTADMYAPSVEYPNGGPTSTVLVCLDAASAVRFETGPGSEYGIGGFKLDWQGTLYTAGRGYEAAVLDTPVLAAGCGNLTFTTMCCHVPHYLVVKASKI